MSFTLTIDDYLCGNSARITHSSNIHCVSGLQSSRNENNEFTNNNNDDDDDNNNNEYYLPR